MGAHRLRRTEPRIACRRTADWPKRIGVDMLLTRKLADALWNDRVILNAEPNDVQYGHHLYGKAIVDEQVVIEERTRFAGRAYVSSIGGIGYPGLCSMGAFSYAHSPLPEPMKMGRYCSISTGLVFLDSWHDMALVTTSAITFRAGRIFQGITTGKERRRLNWHPHNREPFPQLGHDVWIGRDVTLRMGIVIGTGAVIAAKSVVTRDVAPYEVVAGNPARPKKKRLPNDICAELLALEWWRYDPHTLAAIGFDDPPRFVAELRRRIEAGSIATYEPITYEIGRERVLRAGEEISGGGLPGPVDHA